MMELKLKGRRPQKELHYYLAKDGRAGMLRSFNLDGSFCLQFGSGGPFETVAKEDIDRKLTEDEFWRIIG